MDFAGRCGRSLTSELITRNMKKKYNEIYHVPAVRFPGPSTLLGGLAIKDRGGLELLGLLHVVGLLLWRCSLAEHWNVTRSWALRGNDLPFCLAEGLVE